MTSASAIRRIGVLTGGGDCPGLNAVIRAVVKTAIFRFGLEVVGIEDGFQGLVEDRLRPLSAADASGILTRGGTILGTNNKCNPSRIFVGLNPTGAPKTVDRVPHCLKTIERHRLDAMIVIGGDGTMTCTRPFIEAGVPCVGVPKTIDNDIVGTDLTFGFTTAMTTAAEALDRLHSTASSHHRVMVCELMGRNAGWLALYAGAASGSDVILIPEIPYDLDLVVASVKGRAARPRGSVGDFSIIAVAEGARPMDGAPVIAKVDPSSPDPIRLGGIGERVRSDLEARTGLECRCVVLGHVVRGGVPVAMDRVLATLFGCRAVHLLAEGRVNSLVVMCDGRLDAIPLTDVVDRQRLVPADDPTIAAARDVGTCFGM